MRPDVIDGQTIQRDLHANHSPCRHVHNDIANLDRHFHPAGLQSSERQTELEVNDSPHSVMQPSGPHHGKWVQLSQRPAPLS